MRKSTIKILLVFKFSTYVGVGGGLGEIEEKRCNAYLAVGLHNPPSVL